MIVSIAIALALLVVSLVILSLKKKKKPKPSLYKPRNIEAFQSTPAKNEKPQAKKPVKVINVPEKKEKREFTTKRDVDFSSKNERPEPVARKVINTVDRSANKTETAKPEIKLVKKIQTSEPVVAKPVVVSEQAPAPAPVPAPVSAPVQKPVVIPQVVEESVIVKPSKPITNFADFVGDKFDTQYYTVRPWERNKFVEEGESLNHFPDIEVEFNSKRTISIALETIWLENFSKGGLNWASDFDLKSHKQFFSRKRMPYFIVIGVGGTPQQPKELFIMPLQKVETEFLSKADLLHYQKNKVDGNFFYDYSSNVLR